MLILPMPFGPMNRIPYLLGHRQDFSFQLGPFPGKFPEPSGFDNGKADAFFPALFQYGGDSRGRRQNHRQVDFGRHLGDLRVDALAEQHPAPGTDTIDLPGKLKLHEIVDDVFPQVVRVGGYPDDGQAFRVEKFFQARKPLIKIGQGGGQVTLSGIGHDGHDQVSGVFRTTSHLQGGPQRGSGRDPADHALLPGQSSGGFDGLLIPNRNDLVDDFEIQTPRE